MTEPAGDFGVGRRVGAGDAPVTEARFDELTARFVPRNMYEELEKRVRDLETFREAVRKNLGI